MERQYTNYNPPIRHRRAGAGRIVSGIVSTSRSAAGARADPGLHVHGQLPLLGLAWFLDTTTELYHVYVFTDIDCVNRVFTSAIVGSPAYAPRFEHTLALPNSAGSVPAARSEMAKYGEEGTVKMLDGQVVKAADAGGLGAGKIDLWDSSWPEGGYYWTVVPVYMKTTTGDGIEYRDIQLPEDVCRAGGCDVARFRKIGKPVVLADNNAPYISGLSPAASSSARRRARSRSTATRSSPGSRSSARTSTRCSGANAEPLASRRTPLTTSATPPCSRQGRSLVLPAFAASTRRFPRSRR